MFAMQLHVVIEAPTLPNSTVFLQVIHFIRHGQGFHNTGHSIRRDQYEDAQLTEAGWQQAHALNQHIQAQDPPLSIQVQLQQLCMCSLCLSLGSRLHALVVL